LSTSGNDTFFILRLLAFARSEKVGLGQNGQFKIAVGQMKTSSFMSMRGLALLHQIAACALVLLSLHVARATPAAMAAEKPGWQSEWERTLAGAKKEGEVSLWGDAEITHPDIVAAFTKEFPFIKPITVTGKGGDLTVRILSERRAGKYLADVYSGTMGGAAFYEFYRSGVLNPIKPTFILPEVTDESGWLGGKHHYVDPDNYMILYEGNVAGTSIYYNTQSVKPNDFGSYWDLLAPKWKGKSPCSREPVPVFRV
jgi:hypothetical protein